MKSSVRIEKYNETEQRDRKYSSIATGNSNANEREEKSPGHEIPLTLCHYIKQWQRFTFTYVHILPFQTAHPLTNGNNAIKNHIPIWFLNVYSLFFVLFHYMWFREACGARERERLFFSFILKHCLLLTKLAIIWYHYHHSLRSFFFFSLLMCFFFSIFFFLFISLFNVIKSQFWVEHPIFVTKDSIFLAL